MLNFSPRLSRKRYIHSLLSIFLSSKLTQFTRLCSFLPRSNRLLQNILFQEKELGSFLYTWDVIPEKFLFLGVVSFFPLNFFSDTVNKQLIKILDILGGLLISFYVIRSDYLFLLGVSWFNITNLESLFLNPLSGFLFDTISKS